LAIAEVYLYCCRYDVAIVKCDKALEINPRNILGIITKGMTLTVIGRYQEGLVWFDKALEIDPQHIYALLNKGYTFDRLGKYEEALQCYDQALALNPKDAVALERLLGNKGYVHYQVRQYEQALQCYDQALALNPKDVVVLSDKALLLAKLGRKEEALQYSNKAIENIPLPNLMVLYNKSCVMSIFNKPEESLNLLGEVIRL
jgi:tetratricopeptide (TPR) repeat protein